VIGLRQVDEMALRLPQRRSGWGGTCLIGSAVDGAVLVRAGRWPSCARLLPGSFDGGDAARMIGAPPSGDGVDGPDSRRLVHPLEGSMPPLVAAGYSIRVNFIKILS